MPSEAPHEALIRFSPVDLDLFSAASGDANPIHCSASYAASTSYGSRLVFGALGALACLGRLPPARQQGVRRVVADFHRPMFAGVDYTVQIIPQPPGRRDDTGEQDVVRLLDGTTPVVTLTLVRDPGSASPLPETANHPGIFERQEPVERKDSDLQPGLAVEGRYRCDGPALARLRQRWAVCAPDNVVHALLWSSYFIGMEVPGKNAIFFRFAASFLPDGYDPALPLHYDATIQRYDPRLQQLRIDVRLFQGPRRFAEGNCIAFVRASLGGSSAEELRAYMQPSSDLSGKVALVLGASRGLGAATVHLLASQGASVIATARSPLEGIYGAGNPLISTQRGDAGDRAWLEQLLEQIEQRYHRLDVLVCNAFPPIVPLRMEPNGLERLQTYLQQSVSMVLTPLSIFLELLDRSEGCAVVVSSSAVRNPVREWPHYIAAKQAIEGLAAVAPLQYPRVHSLILRPQKLLTEMTNTPVGRKNAAHPGTAAAQLVQRLKLPLPAGVHEILE